MSRIKDKLRYWKYQWDRLVYWVPVLLHLNDDDFRDSFYLFLQHSRRVQREVLVNGVGDNHISSLTHWKILNEVLERLSEDDYLAEGPTVIIDEQREAHRRNADIDTLCSILKKYSKNWWSRGLVDRRNI